MSQTFEGPLKDMMDMILGDALQKKDFMMLDLIAGSKEFADECTDVESKFKVSLDMTMPTVSQ